MKRALKFLVFSVAGLLLLAAVILATLPLSVPPLAQRVAADYGIDLSIEKLRVNWRHGQLELLGMRAQQQNFASNDNQVVRIKRAALDIGLTPLFSEKQLLIDRVFVDGVHLPLQIVLDENQQLSELKIAGIDPASFSSGEPETPMDNQPAAVTFSGWREIKLADINVVAQLQRGEQQQLVPLSIHRLLVGALSTQDHDRKTALGGEIKSQSASLTFSGDASPLAPGREGHLAVGLKSLKIDEWTPVLELLQIDLGSIQQAGGDLSLATNLGWWLAGDRNFATLENTEFNAGKLRVATGAGEQAGMSYGGDLQLRAEQLKVQTNPVEYRVENVELLAPELSIDDPALDPPLALEIGELSAQLDALDSQATDKPSALALKMNIGRYGKFALNGSGNFLHEQASGKLNLDAEQINLSTFSGLAKNAIGKHIDKGALDLEYDAAIDGGQLDSKAKISAHQLGLSGDFGGGSNAVEELGMPINAALNLLRDKHDTVQLNVPVKGDLRDPEIKIGNIVNKALLNGVKTAVFTQFGPLMALTALDKARSMADGLKLKPVEFAAQQVDLQEGEKAATKRLDSIAGLLESRPKIRLNVCGVAHAKEVVATEEVGEIELDEEQKALLYRLAEQRAEQVKDHFVGRGIDGKQLILCAPDIDDSPEGSPRVIFSL